MRPSLVLLVLGLLAFGACFVPPRHQASGEREEGEGEGDQVDIPKNVVQEYFKNNANFSVDPCDDFFAHVCPESTHGMFFSNLGNLEQKMIDEYWKSHPERHFFTPESTEKNAKIIVNLVESGEIGDLCLHPKFVPIVSQFVRVFTRSRYGDFQDLTAFHDMSCQQKVKSLQSLPQGFEKVYQRDRMKLSMIMDTLLVNTQINDLDTNSRLLFQKIRKAVMKAIKKTPWAKNNKSVADFLKAVADIKFATFSDLRKITSSAIGNYVDYRTNCQKQLGEMYHEEQVDAICDVVATGKGSRMIAEPTGVLRPGDAEQVFMDRAVAFNSEDDLVYFGNDFLLLMSTDFLSDIYGSIGFTMAHEIMHTIVFDDQDFAKPLSKLWTKSAKCVEEQNKKTCNTFPTIKCSQKLTFEEDAADLAAYRIVYDLYQRAYQRKEKVENYESLTRQQLFFYGAAAVFCNPTAMHPRVNLGESHTNSYQRINSLMSQMDQFSAAFKCKPTDKMIMNKAEHCELYGPAAPQTKNSFEGFY